MYRDADADVVAVEIRARPIHFVYKLSLEAVAVADADRNRDRVRISTAITSAVCLHTRRIINAVMNKKTAISPRPLTGEPLRVNMAIGNPQFNFSWRTRSTAQNLSKHDSRRSSASHFSSFECTHLNIGV
ncbi:unnamed protein product [Aphis gossypii]|uniref:Uncharacterized protein n=1 Tax=Aphis gossypii TaxID=80765 RepID=A0A9P0NQ87_APHGO|nr:unnamed protein product [Aphis gossypii]